MADPVVFDASNYPNVGQIIVTQAPTSGTVKLEAQRDLYSAAKRAWLANASLNRLEFPIIAIGGQTLPSGSRVPTFFLQSPKWKIRPYESDHEMIIDGNYFPEAGKLTVPTLGGYTAEVSLQTNVGPDAGLLLNSILNRLTETWQRVYADEHHSQTSVEFRERVTGVLLDTKNVTGSNLTNDVDFKDPGSP